MITRMKLLAKSTSFSVSNVDVGFFQLSVSCFESSASRLLENLEWGSYTGDFEIECRRAPEMEHLSAGELYEETWREGSLQGTLKEMPSKTVEMGVCFHRGSVLENMGGRSFLRAFKRRVNFFLLG
jgi:hypothetical protein